MCICIDCHYVDRCYTYHAVEEQHQEPHLTDRPDFDPIAPSINVNVHPHEGGIEIEWDVVSCHSYRQEVGKWLLLPPGMVVST